MGNEIAELSNLIQIYTKDERGTVNNPIVEIAWDADESAENCKYLFMLLLYHCNLTSKSITALTCQTFSKHTVTSKLDRNLYELVVAFINSNPFIPRASSVFSDTFSHQPSRSAPPPLKNSFIFYTYVYLNRRKYSATSLSRAKHQGSSLIQALFTSSDGDWTHCGVLQDIIEFEHTGKRYRVAYIHWLMPWAGSVPQIWLDL